ncbi:MAG: tetratricopeptide repeat protein [Vicinamibacterales bacterium]
MPKVVLGAMVLGAILVAAAGAEAQSASPQSVRALMQLARTQVKEGNASAALESLRKARAVAPNSEEVLSAYAQVSLAAHRPILALVALDALTRICPTVGEYHYLRGVALMQAGDMEAAVDSLGEADRLEPDKALTLTALGLALNNRKQYAEAKSSLARALERDPDSVDATAALAEAEEGLGELDAADGHARRALAKAGGHATAHLVLGMVLIKRGEYAEARDALLAAAAIDVASPKIHYQLSLAYARLGDAEAARRHVDLYQQKLREMEERVKTLRTPGGPDGQSR